MVPNGVPVIGEGGQQLTMYNTNSGAPGGVIYPEKPLGPPVAPEVRSNLPGGQERLICGYKIQRVSTTPTKPTLAREINFTMQRASINFSFNTCPNIGFKAVSS